MPDEVNNNPGFATLNFGDADLIKTFFSILGQCIVEWSFVDRAIFDCFSRFLGTDEKRAAIVYYSNSRFEGRKQLTQELAEVALDDEKVFANDPSLAADWKHIVSEVARLQPFRTILAHQPVQQTGEIIWDTQAPGGPAVIDAKVLFHVTIEEKEVLRGKKTQRLISREELEQHHKDVVALKVKVSRIPSRYDTAHAAARKFTQSVAASSQAPEAPPPHIDPTLPRSDVSHG